jgi:hypothetical protein
MEDQDANAKKSGAVSRTDTTDDAIRTKNKNDLNIFKLMDQFWMKDIECNFTGSDAKLYFLLVHICNKLKWKNPFYQSFRQLTSMSGLSLSSVRRSMRRLKKLGMIEAKFGKSGSHSDMNNKTLIGLLSDVKLIPDDITAEDSSSGVKMIPDDITAEDSSSGVKMIPDVRGKENRSGVVSGVKKIPDRPILPIININTKQDISLLKEKDDEFFDLTVIDSGNIEYMKRLRDFDFYRSEIDRRKDEFLSDPDFVKDQEKDFPRLDIRSAVERGIKTFYSRPAGHLKFLKDFDHVPYIVDWYKVFAEIIGDRRNWTDQSARQTRHHVKKDMAIATAEEFLSEENRRP